MIRSALFLDLANLYHRVGQRFKAPDGRARKIDFRAYLKAIHRYGEIYRAIAYGNSAAEDNNFGFYLRNLCFETKFRTPKLQVIKATEFYDSTYSVELALDLVRMLDRVDVVILGSANPDFIPLVRYVREHGARCIIFACSIPATLRDAANSDIEISEEILESL